MKQETGKLFKTLVFSFFFLMGVAAGRGQLEAQTPGTIVDKGEIAKAFSQIKDTKIFIENLMKKAAEKGDMVAKDCLSPLQTTAQNMIASAESAKSLAESTDLAKAGEGIANLAAIRELYKNLFGQALTCLSKEGAKKDWKGELVNLIQPVFTFTDEEIQAMPEASLEPSPYLSIYR